MPRLDDRAKNTEGKKGSATDTGLLDTSGSRFLPVPESQDTLFVSDFHLGTPESYGDAFRRLAEGGYLDRTLAGRLARAAGFRNLVAHAYEGLDMRRVHPAATEEPADLPAFLARLRDLLAGSSE